MFGTMNGHAMTKSSLSYEESLALLDEKNLSDIESDAGRADNDARFLSREWSRFTTKRPSATSSPFPLSFRLPSRSHCRTLLLKASLFWLPSFVASRLGSPGSSGGSLRLGPTAYLDGMRGLAAFCVFFCHYFYTCFQIAEGWGARGTNYDVLKLPIVRLVYAGPPMVAIFFIVSGYALSLKPLKLARARKWGDLATTLASFVFRRALRLFVPCFVSTLLVVALLRVGAYEWNRGFSQDRAFHGNVQEPAPERKETLAAQLWDWYGNMFHFVHVWGWEKFGGSTGYDLHLWTIPIEFRASMMLFLTLLGLARMRTAVRLGCLALVTAFSYRSDRWEMVLFYCGMLYAELDLIRGAHSDPTTTAALQTQTQTQGQDLGIRLPTTEPKPLDYVGTGEPRRAPSAPTGSSLFTRVRWGLLTAISLYLLSQPDQSGESTPGWATLSSYIPWWVDDKYRYFQCVGAMLFVFCTTRMPSLQRVFMVGPVQYLGKISYALYLMHGPVMHTVGYSIEKWAWSITGTEGGWYGVGFVMGSVAIVPCVVWAADVFWRLVDAPTVRFAKWLEGKCVVGDEERDGYLKL